MKQAADVAIKDGDSVEAMIVAHERSRARVVELEAAIVALLAEPYGCPMCDSGKLRTPRKEHWDTCPYKRAKALLDA